MFSTICYLLSGQPMVWYRYVWFLATGLLTGMCSEGYGFVIGSLFSVTVSSMVTPETPSRRHPEPPLPIG